MSRAHVLTAAAVTAFLVLAAGAPGRAHKPITSPFTYNEDVFPVLREKCGRCHAPGGVAPMSLLTYDDTVPWGESIRLEILARHMPPWSVDAAPGRFHNTPSLSAREMNVLLTWATGGTPLGDPDKTPSPVAPVSRWPLGPPDLELPLDEFALSATAQEEMAEFIVPTSLAVARKVRAVDIAPGTPAIVRSAIVQIRSSDSSASGGPVIDEPVLALWLPGDEPAATEHAGFELPAGAELLVRTRYRKTWQYERQELRDRSSVGLYFAADTSAAVRAVKLAPHHGADSGTGRLSFSTTLDERVQALAIYPDTYPDDVGIVVSAVDPEGARRELISFHPRRGWARRYWFREPIALARGTTIETTVTIDDEAPALPLAPTRDERARDLSAVRLTLNVIAASQ